MVFKNSLIKKQLDLKEFYLVTNKLLILILSVIFLYPLFIKFSGVNFTCDYKFFTGKECRSCGLTRGLQSCFRLDFSKAIIYNVQSIFVFYSIIIQIISRLIISLGYNKILNYLNIKTLLFLDSSIIMLLSIYNLYTYG